MLFISFCPCMCSCVCVPVNVGGGANVPEFRTERAGLRLDKRKLGNPSHFLHIARAVILDQNEEKGVLKDALKSQ